MFRTLSHGSMLVVYYCRRTLSLKEILDRRVPRLFGYFLDSSFQVTFLGVPLHLRNRGIGSFLLLTLLSELKSKNCLRVELDDMSERFNHPHNIYLKCGFQYTNPGMPEMYANPQEIQQWQGRRP